jgi:hypothetical protein
MARTLLIVPDDARETAHWLELAERENAGEIVRGVPPYLADELDGVDLPHVYVEPNPPAPEPEQEPEPDPIEQIRADLDWLITFVVTGEA